MIQQSKEAMFEMLKENSTECYKKKKLKKLPQESASDDTQNVLELTTAEMEIDEHEGKIFMKNCFLFCFIFKYLF